MSLFDVEPDDRPPAPEHPFTDGWCQTCGCPGGTCTGRPPLELAFEAFHAEHPEVYAELHRLAIDLVMRGHRKLGIGMLYEVVRWRTMLGSLDGAYRLNNNHRSRYSRLLMDTDERLAGVFDTRELADGA